jgi:hypothetical protein
VKCPSCGADVEEGADLCLECGEPMGDSAAARVSRAENVIVPPAGTFKGVPVGDAKPPTPVAVKARKWREEEPEPARCPGCGLKTLAARCPSCGTRLRHAEE